MARLHSSVVGLRVTGDDLIPDEITKLLGGSPTKSRTKGDKIYTNPQTGRVTIAKFGNWILSAADREPEDINGQIHQILNQVTDDLEVWQAITKKYHVDLFCGLFMRSDNDGFTISSQCLAALGARGIEISLDIYSGDDE